MKNAIISLILLVLFVLSSIYIFSMGAKENRQNELEESMDKAVKQALFDISLSKGYGLEQEEQEHLVASAIQNIMVQNTSAAEVEIKVLGIDIEKGILDVVATQKYKNLAGKASTVKARRTAVLENHVNPEKISYKVTFKMRSINGEEFILSDMYIREGNYASEPKKLPQFDKLPFTGWSCEEDPDWNGDFSTYPITKEVTFVANYGG